MVKMQVHCGLIAPVHETFMYSGVMKDQDVNTLAGVVELVYTCDSKSHGASLEGSSPSSGTVRDTSSV